MATAMGKRLEGKTIVITGASSGIGASTAKEFAATSPKNLKLVLAARRIDTVKELAAQINKEHGDGVKIHPVQLDVSKADQVLNFIPNLPKEFQDIDVLVNNAGLVKGVDKAGDIKPEDMNIQFETNVTGLINMTQAVLKVFKQKGESGQGDIINIGSIAGREPYPGGSIYCATKAAVRSFTDAMRKELIATRIRIIEIDPGQVETEFSVVRFYGDKNKADKVYEGCTPLTPDDIAETIVWSAGRPENVVIADMLVFPNHQVSSILWSRGSEADCGQRLLQLSCTGGHRLKDRSDGTTGWHKCHVQKACTVGREVVADIDASYESLKQFLLPRSTTKTSALQPHDSDSAVFVKSTTWHTTHRTFARCKSAFMDTPPLLSNVGRAQNRCNLAMFETNSGIAI